MQEARFEGENGPLVRHGSVSTTANGHGRDKEKTPEGRHVGVQAHVPDDTGAFTTLAPSLGQCLQMPATMN